MPDLQKYYLFKQTETTMKTKPNPKLIAALVAIFALPALVAFVLAIAYIPLFADVLLFVSGVLFALFTYKATLWFIAHWDGFKEMVKDMWK